MRSRRLLQALILYTASILTTNAAAPTKEPRVIVTGGDTDLYETLVKFQLPKGSKYNRAVEIGNAVQNAAVVLQVDEDGNAAFIAHKLPRGRRTGFRLITVNPDAPDVVSVVKEGTALHLKVAGRTLFAYQMQESDVPSADVPAYFRHGGYLHPVYSPSGKMVTGDYPADHRWHRGIWFAWTKTEFEGRHPDFWNMGKEKTGTVTAGTRFAGLVKQWNGPIHGGFIARHQFFDNSGSGERIVLNETWEVKAYEPQKSYKFAGLLTNNFRTHKWVPISLPLIFDFVSTQTCATDWPLKLPKYHYGGLGVRGNAVWDPKENVTMLTSEGHDRKAGDSTTARWVWMGGDVDGGPTGMAILMHPENFRFPQPLRLNPNNPQLCIAPSQGGDWEITPGKPYVSKYRFVVFDGKPDAKELDRLWNDYAHPPKVTVE